jgi:type I restriction enzyme, S subunit
MGLKPGYKQTEVGVIPEDWEVKQLGEVVEFLDGRRRPVKDSDRAKMRGDIPYYGASGIVDYVNSFLFDEDLILLGEDGENILSRACPLAFKISGKTWVNNHAHVLRPKPGMSLDYLVEFLESRDYAQYNTGTAQPKLNKFVCSTIPVIRPPLPEQRAIAEALSDVDALIGALDGLIAKKRDLKQAAMQQLLTGQKRLPGFTGEWEAKTLGDVVEKIVGGGTPSRANPVFWGDGIPWVTVKDFATFHPRQTQEKITRLGLENSASNLIPAGTLITSTRMALGKAVIYEVDVAINQDLKALFLKPHASVKFLYYWFGLHGKMIDEVGSGSTVKGISIGELKRLPFLLPHLAEQTAIAEVLSDMDAEIAALEQRRDKTRALKQGMTQELLTGRTRSVDTSVNYG